MRAIREMLVTRVAVVQVALAARVIQMRIVKTSLAPAGRALLVQVAALLETPDLRAMLARPLQVYVKHFRAVRLAMVVMVARLEQPVMPVMLAVTQLNLAA